MCFRTLLLPATLAVALFSGTAFAGPCDAHFTFDGNLQDSGSNGYHGLMIGEDGALATAQFAEGKYGQALQLDGTSAMRSFIDLHYETCPQVAFTAWIQSTDDERTGVQYIVSTGGGRWLGVHTLGTSVVLNGPANGINRSGVLRANAGWIFVAGVYDYETKSFTLYIRNRGVTKKLGNLRNPEEALWIGAFNDGMANPANGILIDDLRIYGQTLSADEISAIQANAAAAQGTETQEATATPTIEALPSCSTHSECAVGNYCAWDHTCHPENHAPMQVLEVMPATAPVEGFILDENARSENDETPDESAVPQSAEAAAEEVAPHPVGEPSYSSVSGFTGSNRFSLDLETDFIQDLRWGEDNDRPCFFYVRGAGVSPAMKHNFFPSCSASVYSYEYLGLGDDRSVISRLDVCNNNNNNKRLKGARIFGTRINEDGSTTFGPALDEAVRQNCDVWSRSVLCPSDQFATGIVIHSNESSGGKQQAVGLQLICRRISVER